MKLKQCFEFPYILMDNLNIAYSNSSPVIAYWNKYQIFLCEISEFEESDYICELNFTETVFAQLILTSNYMLCLDYIGDIYVFPLKFKHSALNHMKSNFAYRNQNVLVIDYNEDNAYSLTRELSNVCFCINKINAEFELRKKYTIISKHFTMPSQNDHRSRKKLIFGVRMLTETEFMYVKDIFKSDENKWNKQILAVISFDGFSLYAVLIDVKSSDLELIPLELFKSPSQISNINFINDTCVNLVVSLMSGTILKLALNNSVQTHVVHINATISKLLPIEDNFIYTDGLTLWKVENAFSDTEVKFKKVNVNNVKDFVRSGDHIICSTYSKYIHIFTIEDETSEDELATAAEYYPAEFFLNNCDLLSQIMKEMERNNVVIKNMKKEENYLTALALCNRHDIMDDIIQYKIVMFENYEEILKEHINLILTNEIKDYYCHDESVYFLIKINTTFQSKFNDILAYLFGKIAIHITLTSNKNVLKTVDVKILEQIKSLNIVVPLHTRCIKNDVTININLVTSIPGALNEKETLWATIHNKVVVFGPEQFIKTHLTRNNVQSLKIPKESLKDLICQTAKHHHGNLFHISQIKDEAIKVSFYAKLPDNYVETMENELQFKKYFSSAQAEHLLQQLSSEEFLRSHKSILFDILNEKVEVSIINDGMTEPSLKTSSSNAVIAFCLRNLLSKLLYKDFDSLKENQSFINLNTFPKRIQNMAKEISNIKTQQITMVDFLLYFEHYQKTIIGELVL